MSEIAPVPVVEVSTRQGVLYKGSRMTVSKAIRLQFWHQYATGRNLKETLFIRIVRMIVSAFYLAKGVGFGVSSLWREQLGSSVIYDGKQCFISNWAGSDSPTISDGNGLYVEHASRDKIVNAYGLSEMVHRFRFGFSFYMNSWHGIDVDRIIYWRS